MPTSDRPSGIHRPERRVANARRKANWEPVENLYRQVGEAIRTSSNSQAEAAPLPEVIVGALAVRIGRVAASYANDETQLITDAESIFANAHSDIDPTRAFMSLYFDKRFEDLAEYTSTGSRRRRPTPFESTVETARRLRDLGEIRKAFQRANTPTAGMLGGSLSYGRFFNVRGGDNRTDSSDIDLLVVVPDIASVTKVPGILKRLPFMQRKELDEMLDRAERYVKFANSLGSTASIFSHKVSCWKKRVDPAYPTDENLKAEYGVSFHVASLDSFGKILWRDRPQVGDGVKDVLLDFRTNTPANGIARGFDGAEERFEHTTHKHGDDLVARFRVFDTIDGRYKPGLHQQLVLPNFESRWEALNSDIGMSLIAFRWKLLERLRYERMRSPHHVQNLSLCHVRYHTFAPHVRRRTDSLELEW